MAREHLLELEFGHGTLLATLSGRAFPAAAGARRLEPFARGQTPPNAGSAGYFFRKLSSLTTLEAASSGLAAVSAVAAPVSAFAS